MPNKTRSDSTLVTGLSSAVDRRLYDKQKELHDRKQAEKEAMQAKLGSLSERGQIIVEWISQERKDTADLTKLIMNVATEEDTRSQLLARQMYLGFLDRAEKRVKKYLKEDKS